MGGAAPVDSGKGGKKSMDSEINLVPFIDLLSCLISFLIVTAVWTQIAALKVATGDAAPPDQSPQEFDKMEVVEMSVHLDEKAGYKLVYSRRNGSAPIEPTPVEISEKVDLPANRKAMREERKSKNGSYTYEEKAFNLEKLRDEIKNQCNRLIKNGCNDKEGKWAGYGPSGQIIKVHATDAVKFDEVLAVVDMLKGAPLSFAAVVVDPQYKPVTTN